MTDANAAEAEAGTGVTGVDGVELVRAIETLAVWNTGTGDTLDAGDTVDAPSDNATGPGPVRPEPEPERSSATLELVFVRQSSTSAILGFGSASVGVVTADEDAVGDVGGDVGGEGGAASEPLELVDHAPDDDELLARGVEEKVEEEVVEDVEVEEDTPTPEMSGNGCGGSRLLITTVAIELWADGRLYI